MSGNLNIHNLPKFCGRAEFGKYCVFVGLSDFVSIDEFCGTADFNGAKFLNGY